MSTDRTESCPDPSELRAYFSGNVSDDTRSAIDTHLTRCKRCEDTIEALEQAELDRLHESPDRPIKGRRLRQYELLEEIGRGGMGMVYRAKHERLDREDAVKILPESSMKRTDLVERFHREIRAVGKLKHPNIVTAYDADEVDGIHFLAMELIDGPDLRSLVARIGRLSVPDACELTRQSATALRAAHQQGLVHRDVKPSNLLLSETGAIKLLDLGLALLIHDQPGNVTHQGQVMGTLDFMAPEQATESHAVDGRADIYSLGCTLYYLLTGHAPYESATGPHRKLMAHASAAIPNVANHRGDVSADLAKLVSQMMAKDPNLRPSLDDIVARLSNVASPANPLALWRLYANLPKKPRKRRTDIADITIDSDLAAEMSRATEVAAKPVKPSVLIALSLGALVLLTAIGLMPRLKGDRSAIRSSNDKDATNDEVLKPSPAESKITTTPAEYGSEAFPYRVSLDDNGTHQSITEAISAAELDDHEISFIQVAPGLYDESLNVRSSVVIQGAKAPVEDNGRELSVSSLDVTRIRGASQSPIRIGTDVPASSTVTLKNLVIYDESEEQAPFNTIDLEGGTLVVDHCKLTANSQNCIRLTTGANLKASHSRLESHGESSAVSTNSHGNLAIEHCEFPNDGAQILQGGATLIGCSFQGKEGLKVLENSEVMAEDCDFRGCVTGAVMTRTSQSGSSSEVDASATLTLQNCRWTNCDFGTRVYLGTITLRGCTLTNCVRSVQIDSGGRVVATDGENRIRGGQYGFEIVGATAILHGVLIEDCNFGVLLDGGTLQMDGEQISGCSQCSIYVLTDDKTPSTATIKNAKLIGGIDGIIAECKEPDSKCDVKILGCTFTNQSGSYLYATGQSLIEFDETTSFVPEADEKMLPVHNGGTIQPMSQARSSDR